MAVPALKNEKLIITDIDRSLLILLSNKKVTTKIREEGHAFCRCEEFLLANLFESSTALPENSKVVEVTEERAHCVGGFPAFLYKLGAQSGWVQKAKANGLKRKDLSKRL